LVRLVQADEQILSREREGGRRAVEGLSHHAVNFSEENRNQAFLKKYPAAEGYPHLFVLDSEGKLLDSQGTAVLEEGKGYSEKAILEFLAKWKPKSSG
jgi:hypothetical protein